MSSPCSLRMYLLIKWHRSAKRQGMLCYSLRRNQKTHLRIVPSFAISPTLIPRVPPVLNRVTSDRKQWKICPVMALLEKQITSHMFHYMKLFSQRLPLSPSQHRIILWNIPTFVPVQREEEMPKQKFNFLIRLDLVKTQKRKFKKKKCQRLLKWKIKTAQLELHIGFKCYIFNFFPSIFTFGKL